jgi:hypothetical protein
VDIIFELLMFGEIGLKMLISGNRLTLTYPYPYR